MNAGSLERLREQRRETVGKILQKIDDVADRLIAEAEDKEVGYESSAGRSTTVYCGQEIYDIVVTVKIKKFWSGG